MNTHDSRLSERPWETKTKMRETEREKEREKEIQLMRQICDVVGQGPVSGARTPVKLGLNGSQKRFKVDVVGFRAAVSVNSICSQSTPKQVYYHHRLDIIDKENALSVYSNQIRNYQVNHFVKFYLVQSRKSCND